jgi:hypothetical protein
MDRKSTIVALRIATMNADPNLLFGAVAVQAGLVEAARFAEVYQTCCGPPGRPVADALLQRGWLNAADRARVEAIVRRLEQATAGPAPDASSPPDTGGDFTPPLPVTDRPEIVPAVPWNRPGQPRYTWTRLHARGGIGQVWLAHDANLEREVALKELRTEAAFSRSLRARFVAEARITGQLLHPGVVPVYELGRRPEDGGLFYAMQFVRGRTLSESARLYHEKRPRAAPGRSTCWHS